MTSNDYIFHGSTHDIGRQFMASVFKALVGTHPRLYLSCVGTFSLVESALVAGYDPRNIMTSDISLYSSVMGAVYSGKPLSDVPFFWEQMQHQEEYDRYTNDIERLAYIFVRMKIRQFRDAKYYQAVIRDAYELDIKNQVSALSKRLQAQVSRFRGIGYEVADLRDVIDRYDESDMAIMIDAPWYKADYVKQFDFSGVLRFEIECAEFDYATEIVPCYLRSKEKPPFYLWHIGPPSTKPLEAANAKLPVADLFFAEESKANRYEKYYVTKTGYLDRHPLRGKVQTQKESPHRALHSRIIESDYEITENTKVSMICVNADVAMYYRDLFAHKMGMTKSELYFVILLDDKVWGVSGFHMSQVMRLLSDCAFKIFAFDKKLKNYASGNRLHSMLLMCSEMRQIIMSVYKKNRIYDLNSVQTTCFTKYRTYKPDANLMELISRERQPTGLYRLVYRTKYYQRDFKTTIAHWLEEEREGRRIPRTLKGERIGTKIEHDAGDKNGEV